MVDKKSVLDKGDRVEIQYGHPVFLTKEEWKIIRANTPNATNEIPKNVIYEDDITYIIDLCPHLKGQKDTIADVIKVDDGIEYELVSCARFAYYTRRQLKLL